jgi:hypothetical protein
MKELLLQTFLVILLTFAIGMAVAFLIDMLVRVMDSVNFLAGKKDVFKRRRKIRKSWKSALSNNEYLNYYQNKKL